MCYSAQRFKMTSYQNGVYYFWIFGGAGLRRCTMVANFGWIGNWGGSSEADHLSRTSRPVPIIIIVKTLVYWKFRQTYCFYDHRSSHFHFSFLVS